MTSSHFYVSEDLSNVSMIAQKYLIQKVESSEVLENGLSLILPVSLDFNAIFVMNEATSTYKLHKLKIKIEDFKSAL